MIFIAKRISTVCKLELNLEKGEPTETLQTKKSSKSLQQQQKSIFLMFSLSLTDCSPGTVGDDLTCLAAVVAVTGKFISGQFKSFVLLGLPSWNYNPRFLSFLFPSSLSPSLWSPLALGWLIPLDFACMCVRNSWERLGSYVLSHTSSLRCRSLEVEVGILLETLSWSTLTDKCNFQYVRKYVRFCFPDQS